MPHRASEAPRGIRPSAPAPLPASPGLSDAGAPHRQRVAWRVWDERAAYLAMLLGATLVSVWILWPVLAHILAAGGLPALLGALA